MSSAPRKDHVFRSASELKDVQFDDKVYVRFEEVRKANWPNEGEVGNMSFISPNGGNYPITYNGTS